MSFPPEKRVDRRVGFIDTRANEMEGVS